MDLDEVLLAFAEARAPHALAEQELIDDLRIRFKPESRNTDEANKL